MIARHAPGDAGCLVCGQPWPCDAARLAADVLELLPAGTGGTGTAGTAGGAEPTDSTDRGPQRQQALLRWRAARATMHAAYEAVRELVPLTAAGNLPEPCAAGLTDLQRRALLDLEQAEEEMDHARWQLDLLSRPGGPPGRRRGSGGLGSAERVPATAEVL